VERIIHCCDVCGDTIENYDNKKQALSLFLPSERPPGNPNSNDTEISKEYNMMKPERLDICLTCLVQSTQLFFKVQGGNLSTKFHKTLMDLKGNKENKENKGS